jgi:ABC-type nitrate/sulfonate/bicarbonate transport system permease component
VARASPETVRRFRSVNWLYVAFPYTLSAVIGLVVWHLVALRFHVTTFPSPLETLREGINLFASGQILSQAAVSIWRIVAGFIMASAIAIPVGLLMGTSNFIRRMLEPLTEFFRFIPAISMIVFAIIWFGIGEMSKIFLVFFNTVFIVIINTEAGVRSVGQNAVRAAEMMGASRLQSFFYVTVPATVPYMVTGMRIAMGRSFSTIVAAEMLGASAGLGFMVFAAREFSRMDIVLVGIVLLGLLGLTADYFFRLVVKAFGGVYVGRMVA